MLRTCYYLAMIAMIFVVRSSEAANCTQATFQQDLESSKVAASQMIVDDYATLTKAQIIAQIYKQYGDEIINADYTVTNTSAGITISFQFIFACNETTVTTTSNGTKQTNSVTSNVNKTAVVTSVSRGL